MCARVTPESPDALEILSYHRLAGACLGVYVMVPTDAVLNPLPAERAISLPEPGVLLLEGCVRRAPGALQSCPWRM